VSSATFVHLAGRSGSTLDRAHGGQAFFAYTANYLVDLDNAIIIDVDATTAIRQAEVTAAKRMIKRTINRFDFYPALLAGDSAYGSAEMIGWLVYEHGAAPRRLDTQKPVYTGDLLSRNAAGPSRASLLAMTKPRAASSS